jgi:hypothetical protein
MTEKEKNIYSEWFISNNEAKDFNGAEVKEYELNKRLG